MKPFPLLPLLLLTLLVAGCGHETTLVERIKQRGELRAVSRAVAPTYQEGENGPTGLEYELLRGFADSLEVELALLMPEKPAHALALVARGRADVAALGVAVTPWMEENLRLGPPYEEIHQQLVYRRGTPRPRSLADLGGGRLELSEACPQVELLESVRDGFPDLQWEELRGLGPSELLERVWRGQSEYTIVQSNQVTLGRRYYPELETAFDLGPPSRLAWGFSRRFDDSLQRAAEEYFAAIVKSGELNRLKDRFYGHLTQFDYVHTVRFRRHIEERLPRYRPLFETTAREHGMEWQLLAAISYQESWWNPKARSPTGVRGLMMLTRSTAKQMGVTDRLDPEASVRGGAAYLQRMKRRLPQRIGEPDRTWLALAAYNIGFAHLEDARVLTQRQGGDPDRWVAVKERLPLLSKKKWYSTVKHGYARGWEPVRYVERVRGYLDQLRWYESNRVRREIAQGSGEE